MPARKKRTQVEPGSTTSTTSPAKRGRAAKKQKGDDTATAESTTTTSTTVTSPVQKTEEKEETDMKPKEDEKNTAAATAAEKSSSENGAAEVLEKGRLYFFYRPKVDAEEVRGPGDIQRFYVLMSPETALGKPASETELSSKKEAEESKSIDTATPPNPVQHSGKATGKHRLLLIASKMFPAPASRARVWAFVDFVSDDITEVEKKLERYSYETKTRGEREVQSARLFGEALYELVRHAGGHTHLVYQLVVPEEPSLVQKAFHINKEGQFLLQVKNPDFDTPAYSDRWAGLKGDQKVHFPSHLQELFKGKRQPEVRYVPLSTPEFLDTLHCELVLIGIRQTVQEEFEEVARELEEEAEKEEAAAKAENPKHPEQHTYGELHMDPKEHPDAVNEFK